VVLVNGVISQLRCTPEAQASLALISLRHHLSGALCVPVYCAFRKDRIFLVIFPLHLLAMFCMFYQLYFVSKNLVLAETGRPASFSDYAGLFLALWFFPIGIWIVQPRINRLIQKEGGVSTQQVNPESA
jgi:hypothetical protein